MENHHGKEVNLRTFNVVWEISIYYGNFEAFERH